MRRKRRRRYKWSSAKIMCQVNHEDVHVGRFYFDSTDFCSESGIDVLCSW